MTERCYNHPKNYAVGKCHNCGRYLCSECLVKEGGFHYCKNIHDCLPFRGKEDHVSSSRLEEERVEEVSRERTDRPEQLDRWAAKKESENYYLRLLRRPRSLRDAVVMAEILTRPGFRRR